MIIDSHAHIFPPDVIARRAALIAEEPAFAEIYGDAAAKMATAEDLLASMDEAGVDRSVIVNFAWHTEALVDETNAYIIEEAARSNGRLIPFVSVYFGENAGAHGRAETDDAPAIARNDVRSKIRRLATAGARGIGELRPENSGYNLANSDEADLLAWAAAAFDLPVLVHASEPVGHAYPGKRGLALDALYAFARAQSGVTIIAAHWGGGLPFYALMPEVRDALDSMYFDTAASHLLYDPAIYRRVIDLVGAEKILWASDFPLTSQAKALERTRDASLTEPEFAAISGGNVGRLLSL
jgi:predicted TIM-barrel fold metal-dependent hydrolase